MCWALPRVLPPLLLGTGFPQEAVGVQASFQRQQYHGKKANEQGRQQMSCHVKTSVDVKSLPSCVVLLIDTISGSSEGPLDGCVFRFSFFSPVFPGAEEGGLWMSFLGK